MSKTKVLIEVRGGNVVSVSATQDIDIVIIDWDNVDNGSPAWNGDVLGQDALFESGEAHELFTDESDPQDMEVRDLLKTLKF